MLAIVFWPTGVFSRTIDAAWSPSGKKPLATLVSLSLFDIDKLAYQYVFVRWLMLTARVWVRPRTSSEMSTQKDRLAQ
jgi:hypothetical protein